MWNFAIYAVLFTILTTSCVSRPNRPDAPLCGPDGSCRDSRGEYQEDARLLICTSPAGYANYEDYIDRLELKIREMERRCKKR